MRTTIDKAGRVVIPKALRDRMGWRGEAEVDIYEAPDGTIAVAPVIDGMPHVVVRNGWAVIEGLDGTVTDEDIRALIDDLRR